MLFASAGALTGCSGAQQGQSGSTMTVNEVLQKIRDQGMVVSPVRSASGGFAQDGMIAETEYGDRIRIFEFQNTASASMEVSRRSSSAGSAPYFYQKGNIMVVHRGNDDRVAKVLEAVFGPKKR